MSTKKYIKFQLGFTLIELLVVIAIVGILAGISMVAVNRVRAVSRDSKRLADVKQFQAALAQYFNTNQKYPPAPADTTGVCNATTTTASGLGNTNCVVLSDSGFVAAGGTDDGVHYMEVVPKNPQPNGKMGGYMYSQTDPVTGTTELDKYRIKFALESGVGTYKAGCYLATQDGITSAPCDTEAENVSGGSLAPPPAPVFTDTFNRAAASTLVNTATPSTSFVTPRSGTFSVASTSGVVVPGVATPTTPGAAEFVFSEGFNTVNVPPAAVQVATTSANYSVQVAINNNDNILPTNMGIVTRRFDYTPPTSTPAVATRGGFDLNTTGNGVFIKGQYAFVVKDNNTGTCDTTTSTGCELSVFDIASSTNPTFVTGQSLGASAKGIYIEGDYVHVATDENTTTCGSGPTGCELIIYKIGMDVNSKPTLSFDSGVDLGGPATGVAPYGCSYIYVSRPFSTADCTPSPTSVGCEFTIFDASSTTIPRPFYSSINLTSDPGNGAYIYGDYAYIVRNAVAGPCDTSTSTGCELLVHDVSSATNSVYKNGFDLGVNANGVYVAKGLTSNPVVYAYVVSDTNTGTCSNATSTGCELRVFDVTTPTTTVTYKAGQDLDTNGKSVAIDGSYAYITKAVGTGCVSSTGIGCEFVIDDINTLAPNLDSNGYYAFFNAITDKLSLYKRINGVSQKLDEVVISNISGDLNSYVWLKLTSTTNAGPPETVTLKVYLGTTIPLPEQDLRITYTDVSSPITNAGDAGLAVDTYGQVNILFDEFKITSP